MKKNRKNFTIIEILVVVCILLLLVGIITPAIVHVGSSDQSKKVVTKETRSAYRGETEYLLIAEDHTIAIVGASTYHAVKVGDTFQHRCWREEK